jgi:hypothetical protein
MISSQLKNLSERELLVLCAERIEKISETMTDTVTQVKDIDVRVRELETKLKVWAAMIGAGSGIASHFIIKFLSQ